MLTGKPVTMDAKQSFDLLDLPGFRFHPTEEELVEFYLKDMVYGRELQSNIRCHNIYLHDPSDLPGLSGVGEREWYFFVPRQKVGGRPTRTTKNGFWKATGSDRKIVSSRSQKRTLGIRKTLVFYYGRAPCGTRTDWIMNEYRLPDSCNPSKVDVVLCKIYRKATPLKVLQQRAAGPYAIHHVNAFLQLPKEELIEEMIQEYLKNEDLPLLQS